VSNIVIAPARTGSERTSNHEVINTAQANSGILCIYMPGARIFITVVIKLIDPAIEETPAMCKLKMAKSTLAPGWYWMLDNGG
jgi:hypothetical protein